jgi:hypothetical protein
MLLGLIYFAEDAMLICRSVQMFSEKLFHLAAARPVIMLSSLPLRSPSV